MDYTDLLRIGTIGGWELEYLSNWQILKKDSTA
jgi:hypothetical protein